MGQVTLAHAQVEHFHAGERLYMAQSPLDDIIHDHAFTRGLAKPQINKLASLASEVTFPPDEVILVEARRSQFFYLVLTGSVTVELCTPRFSFCLQALGAGEAFGWSSLLGHQDTLFRVRARETTTVLRLPGAGLAELCRSDPELGTEFLSRTLGLVARRIRATEMRFAEMCGIRVCS